MTLKKSGNEKLGLAVVVQGVHSQITPDELMGGLFEVNLKDKMSLEAFNAVTLDSFHLQGGVLTWKRYSTLASTIS